MRYLFLLILLVAVRTHAQRAISNDEFSQQETSVAISRTDQKHIVVGSNDDAMDIRSMPAYVTTDGGKTWDTYRIPKVPIPYNAIGDPVVITDNDGGFYYAHLLFHDATGWYNILVSHSQNGKQWTYNSPVMAEPSGAIEDKEWLALDRSPQSPTFGRLYVSWTRLHLGDHTKSGTFISWSDDTGKTWSEAKRIGSFVGTYSLVQTGTDGTIFVSYSQFSEDTDSIGHFMSVSHDFGVTFTEYRVANFINYPYNLNIGKSTLKGGRVISFPYLSYDIDPATGTLHAVYGSYDLDRKSATQFYIFSTDHGATWSEPHIIGDPATLQRDRFQPWVAVDDLKGIPYVMYYSSERDPNNLLTAPYQARVLTDTIIATSIGDSVFNPLLALDFHGDPFIGDYTGADLAGRTFAASWTQNRTGYKDGEIFVYINSNVDSITRGVTSKIRPARFMIESIIPNPVSNGSCRLHIASRIQTGAILELCDTRGTVLFDREINISDGPSEIDLRFPQIAAGTYFVRITSGGECVSAPLIIQD